MKKKFKAGSQGSSKKRIRVIDIEILILTLGEPISNSMKEQVKAQAVVGSNKVLIIQHNQRNGEDANGPATEKGQFEGCYYH